MSSRSWFRRIVLCSVSLATLAAAGCNPLTALYFLFLLPPPKVDAKYTGLEKQTVVVMAYATRTAQFEYAGIDNDLARGVVRDLQENVKGIKLAKPNEVRTWRDEHTNFELTDVGHEFKATRVVYLEVEKFTLFEEQSTTLYRGCAHIRVQVVDMEKDGESVYEEMVEFTYPGARPIPTSDVSRDKFRGIFIKTLTRQVSHLFFEYRPDEDFTLN